MFAEVCREAVVACPLRQYGCLEMLPRRNIAQHLPVCAASGVLVSGVAAASPVARLCIRVSVLASAWPASRADPSWAHTHVRSPAVLLRPAQARREFWSWIL